LRCHLSRYVGIKLFFGEISDAVKDRKQASSVLKRIITCGCTFGELRHVGMFSGRHSSHPPAPVTNTSSPEEVPNDCKLG
jgi:hypothetical protein